MVFPNMSDTVGALRAARRRWEPPRHCCWGWAAQLLHSCCERTERHGPAKSKDEDGTYYLSSRIQKVEVLTLLGTNFLLSEERGTKSSQSQKNHATSAGVDFQANGTHATGPHD